MRVRVKVEGEGRRLEWRPSTARGELTRVQLAWGDLVRVRVRVRIRVRVRARVRDRVKVRVRVPVVVGRPAAADALFGCRRRRAAPQRAAATARCQG